MTGNDPGTSHYPYLFERGKKRFIIWNQIRYCLYYVLELVDEGCDLEQYGNEMGLAALEWVDIFDFNCRRGQWRMTEAWLSDMTDHVLGKLTSQ